MLDLNGGDTDRASSGPGLSRVGRVPVAPHLPMARRTGRSERAVGRHIDTALARVYATGDPAEKLKVLARGTSAVTRRQGVIIMLLIDNRTADAAVEAARHMALAAYRARLNAVADDLHARGALRAGISRTRSRQIFWFYFGFAAWRQVRDLGWAWRAAADWLAEQATGALLAVPADHH